MENNKIMSRLQSHKDGKGEAITLTSNAWLPRDIMVASILPGQIRGNHYHKKREKLFTVISGRVLIGLTDVRTGKSQSFHLDSIKRRMVAIHPNIAFAAWNYTDHVAWIYEAWDTEFDKNDSFFYQVKFSNKVKK